MRTIHTKLTEKQFLARLKKACVKKEPFDRSYNDIDVFVYKLKNRKFWLGKHYAIIGRSDGYAIDRLNCKYEIDKKGYVVIKYRYGKIPLLLIPNIVGVIVGLPLGIALIIDAIRYGEFEIFGFIISAAFVIFGLFGTLFRSKKELRMQEEFLLNICDGI